MSSKSKASSATTSNITDRRIGATDAATVVSEGSNLQVFNSTSDMNALAFAHDQSARSIALAENAVKAAQGINRDSLQANAQIVEGSYELVGETVDRSLDSADSAYSEALEFSERLVLKSIDNVETANSSVRDVSEFAISKVEASTRSDAAQSFNQLLKTTSFIGVAVAVAFAVRK